MEFFRRIKRRTLVTLSLMLALSLLCAQGVALHVHSLDHGHDKYHDHSHGEGEAGYHTHVSKVHLAHDSSHDDHHQGIVLDLDASPDGVLKNLSHNVLALALFALLLTLTLATPARLLLLRHREHNVALSDRYILSPPLRAPPSH